jgi:hypothetical protein
MALPRVLASLSFALLLSACGSEGTLATYAVTLQTIFDCERVGQQGNVSCADEDALAAVRVTGRWVFEYIGRDTFVLLTDDGRTLPGVYFTDTGRVQTNACTGTGGVCHFARVRSSGSDTNGCLRQSQYLVDFTVNDGALSGILFDETFTAEGCASPFLRQMQGSITGELVETDVFARERYEP